MWTCTRDGFVSVWKFSVSPKPSSGSLSSMNFIDIKLQQSWQMKTPVKSACLFSDGGHVCVGTFDGSILLWNIGVCKFFNWLYNLLLITFLQTFSQHEIPVPETVKGHNISCIMDTEYGLWCGVEGIQVPLLVLLI